MRNPILLLDSGLGGLTIFREVQAAYPVGDYVYVADDAAFPYGGLSEEALVSHIVDLMKKLIDEYRPNLVVISCNTASTIVLPELRRIFSIPFVGTVPAIKPACASSVTKRVSVLGTNATVERKYTHALIRDFAGDCHVTLVGSRMLAAYAEAECIGAPASDSDLLNEIAPCFVKDEKATDTIVLACTHYPLLIHRFRALSPWPVNFVDPAPAIARRVIDIIGQHRLSLGKGTSVAIFTSGRPLPSFFEHFGLTATEQLVV